MLHISDILGKHSYPFSEDEWNSMLDAARPPTHYQEWKNSYLNDIDKVERATARIARKARPPPIPDQECWVAIIKSDQSSLTYATRKATIGRITYHELWLDLSQRPHETGTRIYPQQGDVIERVETWDDNDSETSGSDSDDEEERYDSEKPKKTPAIIGPRTASYPRNVGWHLPPQKPRLSRPSS